jgi:predicted transcriptional regulator
MSYTATLTVRLSDRTNDRLDELAGRTQRARGVLVEEAVAAYVERELATVEAIERGRTDVREGRVVPHEVVAEDARAVVTAARAGR